MAKVSVIVPVYNPGADIDPLIDSLLGQTMPAGERELVFVDDGSTDGTGARLDALASEHADVRVVHTPNSGWPGRPRNVGLDLAGGEFVFFADNDDWLERDALERLYAAATTHRADIVVGKVVGHGRGVPHIFAADRHGLDARRAPLLLLTPHKLFRRALLEQHGIRFPEGRTRLEDRLFLVPAYFAAQTLVYHGGYYGMSRADARRRAGEMMDVFDLRAKANTRAPKLSGGMRRRLLLARALMHRAAARDPRRADRGRRLRAAARAVALHPPPARRGHDDPAVAPPPAPAR